MRLAPKLLPVSACLLLALAAADNSLAQCGGNNYKAEKNERAAVSQAERKELENIQSEIDALEQESRALIEELNRGEGDHVRLNSLSQRISQIAADTEVKTARWMELEEKVNGGA